MESSSEDHKNKKVLGEENQQNLPQHPSLENELIEELKKIEVSEPKRAKRKRREPKKGSGFDEWSVTWP
jgi:hypothetical protein